MDQVGDIIPAVAAERADVKSRSKLYKGTAVNVAVSSTCLRVCLYFPLHRLVCKLRLRGGISACGGVCAPVTGSE